MRHFSQFIGGRYNKHKKERRSYITTLQYSLLKIDEKMKVIYSLLSLTKDNNDNIVVVVVVVIIIIIL